STFKVLIAFAKRFTKVSRFVDLEDIYHEFQEVIAEELDYQQEAQHMERFRGQFVDFPGVAIPYVYWEYTTSKVLVMEYIDGVKINELDKLKGLKINPKKLSSILYLSYLKQ
ncbi:AarF/UbiB family protein, partial [Alkalihalophilus pseudofirmus]